MADHIKHKWIHGEWNKRDKGDRYLSKDDVCELCGCARQSIKFWRKGEEKVSVVTYERSKQIFGNEHIPDCWGAKNPQ